MTYKMGGWMLRITTLFALICAVCCGSSSTPVLQPVPIEMEKMDLSDLPEKVKKSADSMFPYITPESNPSVSRAVTYGTSTDWAVYTDEDNIPVLSDIFGDPDVAPRVATKLHYITDNFRGVLEYIININTDIYFSCVNAEALTSSGDTIVIPFYGDVANGTWDDRGFDCIDDIPDGGTAIYGVDSDNIVRVANMLSSTSTNTESIETRGNSVQLNFVIYSTYAEETNATNSDIPQGDIKTFLDIQTTQITIYPGADDDFSTEADNVIFKSRSRITGTGLLDNESYDASTSHGDFAVTKYDKGGDETPIITETLGRGSYGGNAYSIFKIDSTAAELSAVAGTYCIQMPASGVGLPSYADSTNCTANETSPSWGSDTFPFTLTPSIESSFEELNFFDGTSNTEMIDNTGSNFTIPAY